MISGCSIIKNRSEEMLISFGSKISYSFLFEIFSSIIKTIGRIIGN